MGDFTDLPVASGTEWSRADRTVLVDSVRELESLIQRAHAAQGAILAELQSRGVPQTYGYASVEALVKDVARCTRHEAKKRVRRALACHDYSEGTHRVPASAPATCEAFATGEITTAHVDAIVGTLAEIPGTVADAERASYERILVELARTAHPAAVTKAARRLLGWLEQDHLRPEPPLPVRPERELSWAWTRDRQLRFTGRLDTVSGALFEKLLSPLAKPQPAENGERDLRTVDQRHGDALAELLDYTQRVTSLPTEAGEQPTLIVTMTLDHLRDASGRGGGCGQNGHDRQGRQPGGNSGHRDDGGTCRASTTDTGGDTDRAGPAAGHRMNAGTAATVGREPPLLNGDIPISVEEARLLACDARIVPAVLGGNSEVLDLGREQRTASKAQRRALHLRDRGCVFPSCTRPANWTQAHHISEWTADNGPTDLDNLVLLCGMHHRLIHASEWTIRMSDHGTPECIPPPWLDPGQRPRRNRTFAPLPPDTS